MLALLLAANLGVSHFTATGPKVCQRKTLEGVLYLHSFVYEDARDAFVEAQAAAPCPIAYWGEAMTYDHPLWGEQDAPPAKAALAKIWVTVLLPNYLSTTSLFRITGSAPTRRFGGRILRISNCGNGFSLPAMLRVAMQNGRFNREST